MENMSAAPYALPDLRFGKKMDVAMGTQGLVDTMVKDGLWDAFNNYHMGTTAENICDIWGITRDDLDDFGYSSQVKWNAAQAAGKFDDEIVPVPVKVKKEVVDFKVDEFPQKDPSREKMGKLRGAFKLSADNAFQANGCTVEDTFASKPFNFAPRWAKAAATPRTSAAVEFASSGMMSSLTSSTSTGA
jgi:acetyl-CoA acetyltransferase